MHDGAFVVVLGTRHVTVRARLAAVEIRQRAGSDDDWVIASVLVLAASGAVELVTAPLSAATAVLAPFVLLFAGFGGWMLVQRLLQPAVHLDCVAWTAEGAGMPARRAFGRAARRAHRGEPPTAYGGSVVALTAQGRSTVVVGTHPRRRGRGGRAGPSPPGARADPALLTAASGTFRMIDRRRGLRNVPVAARRSAPARQALPSVIVGDFLTLNASVAPTLARPLPRSG